MGLNFTQPIKIIKPGKSAEFGLLPLKMHLYKHRFTNETIEFVGLSNHDLTFRYLGEEFKEIFFSLSKEIVKRYYVEFPKNELAGDYIPEEGRYKARKITQFYPKIA